jgi:hypothetical protein
MFLLKSTFCSYEPEIHPGVTYKLREPKATLKIFSTGSITVTAPSVANVQVICRNIYFGFIYCRLVSLLFNYCSKSAEEMGSL